MPVTAVEKDLDHRTITITAEFAAPQERVWQVYADPRQLERVWGPPECPATVVDHDFTPGSRVTYFMSAPDGQKFHGFWKMTAVEEPRSFSFTDFFADENFQAAEGMPPSENTFTLSEEDGRTTLVAVSTYPSAEALQQVLEMGVDEGATAAVNQIDDLLAA